MLSLSGFPLPFRFLSSASVPVLTTQLLFLPFLSLPVSASQRLPRGCPLRFRFLGFPRSLRPSFPCLPPRLFVLGSLQFLSPSALSPHSGYLGASAFSLSVPGLFPLAFALGSGYSALGLYPFQILPSRSVFLSSVATLAILSSVFSFVNTFFQNFLNFLFFLFYLYFFILFIKNPPIIVPLRVFDKRITFVNGIFI